MTAKIILGTDNKGLEPHATLVASILRRSSVPIHIRCYYRGSDKPSDFTAYQGWLKVEFLDVVNPLVGTIPAHITLPCFDRVSGVRDFTDWDKALMLDWDQLCLMDVAEFFKQDMGDNLMAARLDEETIIKAASEWFQRQLPSDLSHLYEAKWPWLGCMFNLSQMRAENTWEKIVGYQNKLGWEEQLSIALAVEGRIREWPYSWNCCPLWEKPADWGFVLHYSTPRKPWDDPKMPAANIWWQEKTDWNDLRQEKVKRPPIL